MLGYTNRRQRAGQGGRLLAPEKWGIGAEDWVANGTTAGASEVAKAAWQESCGGDCAAVRQPVRDCRRKLRGREKPSHQGWRTGKGSGICARPKARSVALFGSRVPSAPLQLVGHAERNGQSHLQMQVRLVATFRQRLFIWLLDGICGSSGLRRSLPRLSGRRHNSWPSAN